MGAICLVLDSALLFIFFFQNMPAPDHVNVVNNKLKSCDLLLASIRLLVSIVTLSLINPSWPGKDTHDNDNSTSRHIN